MKETTKQQMKCPRCKGIGKIYPGAGYPSERCDWCKGTGINYQPGRK